MKKILALILALLLVLALAACGATSNEAPTPVPNVEYSNDEQSLKLLFETVLDDLAAEDLSIGKVGGDDSGGWYVISYHPTDVTWDETAFVRRNLANYINFCKAAYQIDGVSDIDFEISTTMMDAKGNESVYTVQSIWMSKDEFETFNWENLEYKKIFDVFKDSCEIFWLYPGIANNITTDDIYYAP